MTAAPLLLPTTDLARLKRRVQALAEQRPAVYRMISDSGRVLYVGKARQLRARLLSYFRANYPDDKAARILQAAADIQWEYVSSEFAALLTELRAIRRYRPAFNVRMNRTRRNVLIKLSGGPAPRLYTGTAVRSDDRFAYGPFGSQARTQEAVRVLNDLLGLRDCTQALPVAFDSQRDLFDAPRQAGCIRFELGTCTGPCAAFVSEAEYRRRVDVAAAFLEGRALAPLDRVIAAMTEAAAAEEFERAALWRFRFEQLEWLLAATSRARTAVDLLTFVFHDVGPFGDERAWIVRQGAVRAVYPWPATPIEREAFCAVVRAELDRPMPPSWPLPLERLDEILLVTSWFRRHPDALRQTSPLNDWA